MGKGISLLRELPGSFNKAGPIGSLDLRHSSFGQDLIGKLQFGADILDGEKPGGGALRVSLAKARADNSCDGKFDVRPLRDCQP